MSINENRIYLDHAATTPVSPEVLAEMMPCFGEYFGNPSSVHAFGRDSRKLAEAARARIARAIGAKPNEIYFTAGGTEADNWAIKGVCEASGDKTHIITSAIEHHAVLHAVESLEKKGWRVTYIPVDSEGFVNPKAVEAAITTETALVTIMMANNEIGTIMPINEIGAICKAKRVPFHTDAVQAVGHIPVNVEEMNITMLSLSAHKLFGPKGIGALYIKNGTKIAPFIHGGAQERGRRAGTEPVALMVGLGAAIERAVGSMAENEERTSLLRDRLFEGILKTIPDVKVNGPIGSKRLPGNVNVSFKYVEGEGILLLLDSNGIAASSGSACTSGSLDPSHVLLALGMSHEESHGSVRMTLSHHNTPEEIDFTVTALAEAISRLRAMSPLFAQEKGGTVYV